MCSGWNATSLSKDRGRQGSGWIDSAGSKGTQKMVITRRDCAEWKPIYLSISADEQGNAMCRDSGIHTGGSMQWKFEPSSASWIDFTDGFGVFDMPSIMEGFVGPYSTAMNNIGNFEVFFAMVGQTAISENVSWQCNGFSSEQAKNELSDVDIADMRSILK